MADAIEIQIADAIVHELNTGEWSQAFTAERLYLPVFSHEELADELKVCVVPLQLATARLNRQKSQCEYSLGIDVQKRVEVANAVLLKQACDALTAFAETVHDAYRTAHRLDSLPDWAVVNAQREDLYDMDKLYAQHVWETLIVVEVRGYRP